MKLPSLSVLAISLGLALACGGGGTPTSTTPPPPPTPPVVAPTPPEVAPTPPPVTIAGAGTEADPKQLSCYNKAKDLGAYGHSIYVMCPAGCTSGSVYGTCTYTADSAVCVAANHAGVLPGAPYPGGVVQVKSAPGMTDYPMSTNGAISSSHWPQYDTSFVFDGCGSGAKASLTSAQKAEAEAEAKAKAAREAQAAKDAKELETRRERDSRRPATEGHSRPGATDRGTTNTRDNNKKGDNKKGGHSRPK